MGGGFSHNADKADVLNREYKSKGLNVTDAADVIANINGTAGNNLAKRQAVTVTNAGPDRVYYGEAGSAIADRDYLEPQQFFVAPAGPRIDIAFKCDTGKTANIRIQEWSN